MKGAAKPLFSMVDAYLFNYGKMKQKVTFDPKQVYDFELEKTLDESVLLKQLGKAIESGQKKSLEVKVSNTDRTFGTILGSEITEVFCKYMKQQCSQCSF